MFFTQLSWALLHVLRWINFYNGISPPPFFSVRAISVSVTDYEISLLQNADKRTQENQSITFSAIAFESAAAACDATCNEKCSG
jgi:hypothetical protein